MELYIFGLFVGVFFFAKIGKRVKSISCSSCKLFIKTAQGLVESKLIFINLNFNEKFQSIRR